MMVCISASDDFPLLLLCDKADAGPAVFLHRGEVFEALEIHGHIGSLLLGGFLADGEGFVDVVNAADFEVVGAVSREGEGDQGQENQHNLHCRFIIKLVIPTLHITSFTNITSSDPYGHLPAISIFGVSWSYLPSPLRGSTLLRDAGRPSCGNKVIVAVFSG